MPAWTPRDLANQSFVVSQLSPKDRSYALNTVTRELDSAQPRLAQQEAELAAADAAYNNRPDRRVIRELLAKAQDQTLSQTERDASAAEAAKLQDERERLSAAADQALQKVERTREYVNNLTAGQSNLLQAGAVPPGENLFAAPPGYEERNAPAAQVPDSQNPNPVPTAATTLPDNAVPPATGEATQDQANEINAALRAEEQLQVETELGATENEANLLIKAQREADQLEYETQLGATEGEANLLIKAQQEADQLEYETQLGATESEANLLIKAQREADANEFSLGATQAEADVINEQKQVSDFESGLGAAGATQAEADAINNALASAGGGANRGLSGPLAKTRGAATNQDASNFQQKQDWRVRLSLAPGSTYLYNNKGNEGILLPLAQTDGVIFPYTPAVSVAYSASYDNTELTHSNYKFFSYRASSVDSISITCDFTAQDTFEANYLLAVIHFFRSVTKMFYGQDQNPKPGTPPPLCYLTGLGAFQFDAHPLAITGFTYSLPTDVDYIRAGVPTTQPGVNKGAAIPPTGSSGATNSRLQSSGLQPGALAPPVYFTENAGTKEPTYVPTKIQMAITAVPIVTRNDISNQFSLREYGTGKLLRGSRNRNGGGIW